MAVMSAQSRRVLSYLIRQQPTTGWLGKMYVAYQTWGRLTDVQLDITDRVIEETNAAEYAAYAASLKAQFTAPPPAAVDTPAPASVEPGTYTVAFADAGHVTLRVRKSRNPRYPDPKLDLLTGPDNEISFTSLGHIHAGELRPWESARSLLDSRPDARRAVDILLGSNVEARQVFGQSYSQLTEVWEDGPDDARVLVSVRCYRCGRLLTVPDSIDRGMGPECATK